MCFMAIFMTSLEKRAFRSLSDFFIEFFLLLFIFSCTSDLYLFVSSVQELGSVILILQFSHSVVSDSLQPHGL